MRTVSTFFALILFALLMALIALFAFAQFSHAAPFLICDPQTNVTHYVVTLDGDTSTAPAFDLGDGTLMLKYDLAGIPAGAHNVQVKAKNLWGESIPVPFDFTKALPDVPGGIRIE